MAILTPILKLLSTDFDQALASIYQGEYLEEEKMKNLIENKKTIIQAGQEAYIVEQMAVQMKNSVKEELVNKYGVHIVGDLAIQTNEQFKEENLEKYIVGISINLTKASTDETNNQSIETVRKVEINLSEDPQTGQKQNEQSNFEKEIQAFLAKKWGLSKDKITVQMEGG